MPMLFAWICAVLLALPLYAHADALPSQAFAKKADFHSLKLSPDGKIAAALVPDERHNNLVFIRVADNQLVGRLRLETDYHVADYWWANDHRVVASLALQFGALDAPRWTGELVAVDSDGKNFTYLYGFRRASQESFYSKGSARFISAIPGSPDHVLVAIEDLSTHFDTRTAVASINVNNGARSIINTTPLAGGTRFLIDHQNRVRFAVVSPRPYHFVTFEHLGESKWGLVELFNTDKTTIEPLAFSEDDRFLFLSTTDAGGRACLEKMELETKTRQRLACDDVADLESTINAFGFAGEPIAAVFEDGKPRTQIISPNHPHAAVYQQLLAAFPGKQVTPTSSSWDGRKLLVFVQDDRSPGDYYLFDTQTLKADYFTGLRGWIDPDQMSERRPFRFATRDGQMMSGYLTLPQGLPAKQLPLVINPHGGPFGERDHWRFDPEAQMLANHGYAVLQLNFRGSGGYGVDFLNAGRKAWGTTMIDDLTDAAHWAIDQGYVDARRVCIYGASYGGFAALMSAVREPDLYRCAIGYAGVYDLKALKEDADFTQQDDGKQFFADAIAGAKEEMIAQSPITYLNKLQAAVMIVHGKEDARAPYNQATRLRKALEQRKKPYEWLVKSNEGHGFWKEANIIELYDRILAFLDRNIGAAAPITAAAPEATKPPATPVAATTGSTPTTP